MEKKWIAGLGILTFFVFVGGGTVQAQYNPNGFIQNRAWDILMPLLNPGGATGGGADTMLSDWIPPVDLTDVDFAPVAGEAHDGTTLPEIDFDASPSSGYDLGGLSPNPIWVNAAFLEAAFADAGFTWPADDTVWYDTSSGVPGGVDCTATPEDPHCLCGVGDGTGLVEVINRMIVGAQAVPGSTCLPRDNILEIAITYVENTSGAPLLVNFCAGSDDSLQIILNNVTIWNHSVPRGVGTCSDNVMALLPVGVSKITCLVWEGGGGNGLRLQLQDETGAAFTDADVSRLKVLGPNDGSLKGQVQYGATRSRVGVDPLSCEGLEVANIEITGNGAGDPADAVTVVETIAHAQGADITVDAPGATVEDVPPPALQPVGDFDDHRIIGNPDCTDVGAADPSGSDTTYDSGTGVYVQSNAGNSDLWNGGDTFEFAYNRYEGDLDVSIVILDRQHLESTNNWGKVGIMVRDQLIPCSRHFTQIDPYPNSRRQIQGRSVAGSCNDSYGDEAYAQVGDPLADVEDHPPYYRLTRRSGVLQAWVSSDPAVETDPTNDALWAASTRTETWSGDGPVYVGLVTAEHSSDCGVMVMTCKVLNLAGTKLDAQDHRPIGKTITWDVTRADVDAGLSYTLSTASGLSVGMSGEIHGEALVGGLGSVGLQAIPHTGPVGIFENSRDIGNVGTPGLTTYDAATDTYTDLASGADIWNGGDTFHFSYKRVTGDFVATVHIASREISPANWGRHGLMARWTCQTGSKFSMSETVLPEEGGVGDPPLHLFRVWDNQNNTINNRYQIDDGVFPTEGRNPTWMRLVRIGNTMYTYMSEDDGGRPAKWLTVGADDGLNVPETILVGMANQAREQNGGPNLQVTYDNLTIEPLNDCFVFDPIDYETSSTKGSGDGLGSMPYAPIQVAARVVGSADEAKAAGGSGLGVKDRNWFWTDLTVGALNLEGTQQLLWNNENRNYPDADLVYSFRQAATVYIAWDDRHVKGGSDNANGDVDNGWFDFNNDVGTINAQGWMRLSESLTVDPAADVLVVDGDDHFARGGVWAKNVVPGDVLEFLSTGFDGGRSPYVVFVDCGGTSCAVGEELSSLDYETPDDMGVAVQGGDFAPAVVDGRLRLTDQATAGSANAVWYGVPAEPGSEGAPLLKNGFYAEFDAFMTRDIPENPDDRNPADGMTFAAVSTGMTDGLATAVAPPPQGLEVATLRGDGGGALGFDGNSLLWRTDGHPSFAVEMDNWVGGGTPGNEPGDGGSPNFDGNWHIGVDVDAGVSSIQTNANFGVPSPSLPDIFSPDGVHVEVMYRPSGRVSAWVTGVDKEGNPVPRTQVLSARIAPLAIGDLVIGFTGGTGGATSTQEIDNFKLSSLCCEASDTVTISGPSEANQRDTATYTADVGGSEGETTYLWEVVSGSATIAGADQQSADVTFDGADDVVLRVTTGDGLCADGAAAEITVTVTAASCDVDLTCTVNDDNLTVSADVTVGGPEGCVCDEIVILRDGTEVYRGPADAVGDLPLPEGCETGTEVVYKAFCTSAVGDGIAAECTVTCPALGTPFIRGDCNQDGEVCRQVSDIVRIVEICFLGLSPDPSCPAACDANGDGDLCGDVSDILYLANYCFTGLNGPPPAPFPDCGIDENAVCEGVTFCNQ